MKTCKCCDAVGVAGINVALSRRYSLFLCWGCVFDLLPVFKKWTAKKEAEK